MNFASLLGAIARKKFMATPQAPKPARTATPLRASQGSAVEIELVPMILANSQGAMFGDFPTNNTVVAVGQFTIFDGAVRYYHIYLSGQEGSFLSIAMRGTAIIETRLYRLYTEANPESSDDWAFWLDDDGFIGKPTATSLDVDGAIPFNRAWGSGSTRIAPYTPIEMIVDSTGDFTRLHHMMMQYSRPLKDEKIAEHLLVSAIAENSTIPSGVTFWLGIDVDPSEIKVYPAADTPAFP